MSGLNEYRDLLFRIRERDRLLEELRVAALALCGDVNHYGHDHEQVRKDHHSIGSILSKLCPHEVI